LAQAHPRLARQTGLLRYAMAVESLVTFCDTATCRLLLEHQESSLNRRRMYSAIAARPLVTMLENALKGGWVVIKIIRIGQGHSMRIISNSNSSRLPQGWPRRRGMYEHRPFSQVAFPEMVFKLGLG